MALGYDFIPWAASTPEWHAAVQQLRLATFRRLKIPTWPGSINQVKNIYSPPSFALVYGTYCRSFTCNAPSRSKSILFNTWACISLLASEGRFFQ